MIRLFFNFKKDLLKTSFFFASSFLRFVVFINIFVSCTKKQLDLPSVLSSTETPNVYLNSPEHAQSTVISLVAGSCSLTAKLYITEDVNAVPSADTAWQICTTSRTQPLTYNLTSATVGTKNLYIWGLSKSGKVLGSAKKITLKYVPKIVIGKSSANDNYHFKKAHWLPMQVKQINGKYYFSSQGGSSGLSKISVYNSIPTSNFVEPDLTIGHPNNFLYPGVRTGPNRLYNVTSFDSDGTKFAIVDNANNRVLLWNQIPTNYNTNADVVLGQSDFWKNGLNNGKGATSSLLDCADLSAPRSVKIHNGKVYVSDYGNNRVLVWNSWPTANNQAADFAIGQTNCSNATASVSNMYNPMGIETSGTKLFIADYINNRVLIWNTLPTTFSTTPDLILGQSTASTNTANLGGMSASSLYRPAYVSTDGTRLLVTDSANYRVLIWNSIPTTNAQAADVVVGQTGFTTASANLGTEISASSLYPSQGGADIIGGNLWISDSNNHRFLKYNGVPSTNGEAAVFVYNQSSFRTGSPMGDGTTDKTLNRPFEVEFVENKVYISLYQQNRILGYNTVPTASNASADFVWGQADLVSDNPNKGTPSTTSSLSLYGPMSMTVAGAKFLVSDNVNNRILGFNSQPTANSTTPDFVVGQSSFTSMTANAGGISAATVSGPRQVSSDGAKLAVADYGNHRVLIWNTIPSSSGVPADVIIGQPDATSNTANKNGISAATLNFPNGVLLVNNKMVVSDTLNRRVLIWDPIPSVTGTPANYILGQSDFVSSKAIDSNIDATLRIVPSFISSKDGNLIIPNGNYMNVSIWDRIPTANNQPPDRLYGSSMRTNFSSNISDPDFSEYFMFEGYSVKSDGARLWIADNNNNRVNVVPIPDVSVTSANITNNPIIQLTVHNCENHAQVLFNESTEPSSSDFGWQTCSITRNAFNYTVSSGEGFKIIKVWFKDSDGNVIPNAHTVTLWYLTSNNQIAKGNLTLSSSTNSLSITYSPTFNSTYANSYYISESSTTPSSTDSNWQIFDGNSINYTVTNTTPGVKTIYVWTKDPAGNVSSTPNLLQYTYDLTPPAAPSVSVTSYYSATYSTLAKLTVTSCSDISKIYVSESSSTPSASDTAWVNCSTTNNAITFNLTSATEGNHTLKVWSKDAAGNVSSAATDIAFNFNSSFSLGQSATDSLNYANQGLLGATDISSDGTRYIISDYLNGRVLLFNSDPTIQVNPDIVFGQSSETRIGSGAGVISTTATDANSLSDPYSSIIVGSKVIIVDPSRNCVLIWNTIPTSNNQPADVVIGQLSMTGLTANSGGISCATLNTPRFVSSDGTRLIVADYANNRVLVWNSIPTVNGQPADLVVGQANCTSNSGGTTQSVVKGPIHANIYGGKLYVTEYLNNRITIWNSVPSSNGASADIVVGQTDFTSSQSSTKSASTLSGPFKTIVYNNKMYVMDRLNNRLLVYNTLPTANTPAADIVLGQSSMTASSAATTAAGLNVPAGFWVDNNYLWIADNGNSVIKRYSMSLTTGMSATALRGNSSYTSSVINARTSTSASSSNLYRPTSAVIIGSKLAVVDNLNNRVLIWNSLPTTSTQAADVVIGHNNFTTTTANDTALTQGARLSNPTSVATDGVNLMIADYSNNRVLIWNSVPTSNGSTADLVLGQSSLTGISANRGGAVAANTLSAPAAILYSGSKLFVADLNNNRVLIWNSMPSTSGQSADVAVGQSNLTSNTANAGAGTTTPTASGLYLPRGLAVASGKLFITEYGNNRVTVRNSVPTSSGSAADLVIGQTGFTSQGTGTSATALSRPYLIKYLNNKLFIADCVNNRIVGYNSLPTSSGQAYDFILGQYSATSATYNLKGLSAWSLSCPMDIDYDGANYWIVDTYNHRINKLALPF